jgi:hypothetical protein
MANIKKKDSTKVKKVIKPKKASKQGGRGGKKNPHLFLVGMPEGKPFLQLTSNYVQNCFDAVQ